MKKITMALSVALVAGMGFMPDTAFAGRKEAPPEGPTTFILSKQIRELALNANLALKAGNLSAADTAITAMEAAAGNDSERYVTKTLRVKLLSAQTQTAQTMTALIKPLEELLADPRTPKSDAARYAYTRGDIAYAQKLYPKALQYYLKAREEGLQDEELSLQIVRANMEAGTVSAGAAELDGLIAAQVAAGKKPPESWYRYAVQHLRDSKAPEADAWVGKWLAAYGTRANWHDAIAINGFKDEDESKLSSAERTERDGRFVDLLRLMRVTHSLAGQKEYIDYARRADSLGLKDEAKSVIEEGRASGAIPPKDADAAHIFAQASARSKGAAPTESAARKAKDGELAADLGGAFLGKADYPKAAAMYDLALEKTVKDAETVHLHRGIAYALAGERDKARADFAAVTRQPIRETAVLWTIWLNSPPAP